MTGDMSCLNASSPVHSTVPITIANGSTCNASKIGSVSVRSPKVWFTFKIWFVPQLSMNLLSIGYRLIMIVQSYL